MDREQILSLAYAGIDEAQPWAGFVDGLVEAFDAHDASLLVFSKRSRKCCYHVTSDKHAHWTRQLLREIEQVSYLMEFDVPEPATEAEWGRIPEFRNSELFRSYLAPVDITHMLMQDVYSNADFIWRVAAARTSRQRAFGRAEQHLLQALAPHLQQAIAIRERIAAAAALPTALLEVIDNVAVGCIVVDSHRRVLAANDLGRRVLGRGLDLRASRGELHAALQQAIDAHLERRPEPAGGKLQLTLDGEPCPVIVKPVQSHQQIPVSGQPAALLLIDGREREAGQAQEKLLREHYGLTPAEAAVCLLLKGDRTLAEAAELRGVSVSTVKTHLRAAYQKLQFHRRSQLVKFLADQTRTLA